MNIQEPKCGDGYILDKEKCMCVVRPKRTSPIKSPKKNTVKKRTRCPKRTRKNVKTGKCESTIVKPLTPSPIKKHTRCPNGTRRNVKTGKCEPSNIKGIVANIKKKEQPIVIPSSTPADIAELSREVSKHIREKKPISPEKMTELIKSFSPSIHARLEQLNSSPIKGTKLPLETQRSQMLDCLDEDTLISKYRINGNNYDYTFLYDKQMPHIYVDGGCYPAKNLKSQKLLLKSLNDSIKRVNMTNLVTPKQYASNCWFNSFFVVFFIGDKGRKFSKSLRHMMITQRGPEEKTLIDNLKMRKTMFAFNLAIEASLTGNPIAYKLNTNSFVVSLAESMPKEYKKNMPKYTDAANPITFYEKLMIYFEEVHNVKGISISRFKLTNKVQDLMFPSFFRNVVNTNSDLITIAIYDKGVDNHNKSKYQKKPEKISYDSKEYTLGAAVIRDTKRRHFCCVCDVNGKEYGFDGASFKRLNPFEWRKLLNKNKTWTFEGSNWEGGKEDGKSILWNFMNGYQILFYYRTK